MHDLPHLPHHITVPKHRCMIISYACLWQDKESNPNLAYKEQTNNNTWSEVYTVSKVKI